MMVTIDRFGKRFAAAPPEAKAVWLPPKSRPLKGLLNALYCLPAPSLGLAFWSAEGLNPRRFYRRARWYTLLVALVLVTSACVTREMTSLVFRAQLYGLVERYDDAITGLTTVLELDPQNPELYLLRGQMYLALYEWDKALADYNAAIELAPDDADAYYYRGVLYASILQTGLATRDDALTDFRRYLDLAPDGDHAANAAQAITDLEAARDALSDS